MIEARFRYRTPDGKSVAERHSEVLRKLESVVWLWGEGEVSGARLLCSGESASCSLSPLLRKGISGSISYAARVEGIFPSKAMYDDVLLLEIDENEINYPEFAGLVFERISEAFSSYRATIVLDLNLDMDDYEEIVQLAQESGKDVDGRDSIFRFNTVNLFDSQLCLKALGLSLEGVWSRLEGEVERVAVSGDHVLIVATSDLVDRENLEALNVHISGLLEQ